MPLDIPPLFQTLGLALAIGFLIGVERGWRQRGEGEGQRTAGLRTYSLIGLLGGIAGQAGLHFGVLAFAAIALVFGAAWILFKYREHEDEDDYSITGLVGGLIVFSLGAYAQVGDMAAAAAAGVVTAAILAFKQSLHAWLRGLTWPEVRSAILILAMSMIALPLLPDRALDPYGAFNPRSLWMLTILIAGASFAGYVALRAFGEKAGLFLGAGAGAMASSTVVTLDLARRVGANEIHALPGAAAAMVASLVMIARVTAITAAFAAPAFQAIVPELAAGALLTAALLGAYYFLGARENATSGLQNIESPLDFKEVFRFALVLSVITVAARMASAVFGPAGALVFATTAGLVDVDAVTLAAGSLLVGGASARLAADAVLLAVLANTASKTGMAFYAGKLRFGLLYAAHLAAMLVAFASVRWFMTG